MIWEPETSYTYKCDNLVCSSLARVDTKDCEPPHNWRIVAVHTGQISNAKLWCQACIRSFFGGEYLVDE